LGRVEGNGGDLSLPSLSSLLQPGLFPFCDGDDADRGRSERERKQERKKGTEKWREKKVQLEP